ncbi:MAG: HU family DNA-binding protein [Gammaproteobacteria bacterium]|nr:HU family DNA-binding protein [Gammaproteobacteria bacterium]
MVAKKKAGTKKKAATKKVAAKKAIARPKVSSSFTRSSTLSHIADSTGITKKDVSTVIDSLKAVVEAHVKAGKIFTLPGLLKVKVTRKPATKARKGVNPFTGQEMMFKAKPARNVVKIQALKSLKDMA